MQERKGRAAWVLEGHDRTLRNTQKMHGNHRLCLINAQHRVYTNISGTCIPINGSGEPALGMCILRCHSWETEGAVVQQGAITVSYKLQ